MSETVEDSNNEEVEIIELSPLPPSFIDETSSIMKDKLEIMAHAFRIPAHAFEIPARNMGEIMVNMKRDFYKFSSVLSRALERLNQHDR